MVFKVTLTKRKEIFVEADTPEQAQSLALVYDRRHIQTWVEQEFLDEIKTEQTLEEIDDI